MLTNTVLLYNKHDKTSSGDIKYYEYSKKCLILALRLLHLFILNAIYGDHKNI